MMSMLDCPLFKDGLLSSTDGDFFKYSLNELMRGTGFLFGDPDVLGFLLGADFSPFNVYLFETRLTVLFWRSTFFLDKGLSFSFVIC